VDGFTTYGIKLWQPEVKEWLEVSVLGNTFAARRHSSGIHHSLALPIKHVTWFKYVGVNGEERFTEWGNQLTDGSLIDVCGVTLMFQNPVHMAVTSQVFLSPSNF